MFHCHIVSHRILGMSIVLNVDGVGRPPEGFPLSGHFEYDDDRRRAIAAVDAALSSDDDDDE